MKINCDMQKTRTQIFRFEPQTGVKEYHVMIHISDTTLTFEEQLQALNDAIDDVTERELSHAAVVMRRYFVSDAANQTAKVVDTMRPREYGAYCIVEQPPLDGTKIAVWLYMQSGVTVKQDASGQTVVSHGTYTQYLRGGAASALETSHYQTASLLSGYSNVLRDKGLSLKDNCVRTWFFVQNVDVNYAGVVSGRNEVFEHEGLLSTTHFISSTGIGGRHADKSVLVQMDTYAVAPLQKGQVGYLYARTHLNPTYEYGVAFERGTTVDYGDRRHVLISGTASIDNKGAVVWPGDIRRQTLRMWENVEALLTEGGASFDDMGQMIVYLRDMADYDVVNQMYEERFPNTPRVIVHAPVCRSGWLIEMECMGVKAQKNEAFDDF